jgi:predicted Zn finger-like uncharacterized protein
MVIRCERCGTRYEFDDAHIGDAGPQVRCSSCGYVFSVKRKAGSGAAEKAGSERQVEPVAPERWEAPRARSESDSEPAWAGGGPLPIPEDRPPGAGRSPPRRSRGPLTAVVVVLLVLAAGVVAALMKRPAWLGFESGGAAPDAGAVAAAEPTPSATGEPATRGADAGAGAGGAQAKAPAPPPSPYGSNPSPAPAAVASNPAPTATATPTAPPTPKASPLSLAEGEGQGEGGRPTATPTATPTPTSSPLSLAEGEGQGEGARPTATPTATPTPTPAAPASAEPSEPTSAKPEAADDDKEDVASEEAAPAPAPSPSPSPQAAAPTPPAPAETAPAEARPDRVARAAPLDPKAQRRVKALLGDARRMRNRGKPEAALELYGQAIQLDPQSADALAGRGLCYLDLSQYAPAESSFETALRADAQNGAALMGLAETFRYEGRRADAVKYYEQYLAAHPRGEDALAARNAIQALKE